MRNGQRLVLGVLLAGWLAATPSLAHGEPSREYQLKAAFIYNFVQFVDWPKDAFADNKSPIVLAVVRDDPFAGALDRAVAGKAVGGRPLVIKHVSKVDDVKGCHLVFVGAAAEADLDELFRRTDGTPVLTVGETDRFMDGGGIIRFYQEDNKLRFEINPRAAQRARLRMSAKLLKLARIRGE